MRWGVAAREVRIPPVARLGVLICVAAVVAMSCRTASNVATGEHDFTTPDGVRLHYRVIGQSPSIVLLLHGGPGSNFNAVWPDLTPLANRHTVVMYDQRGGGRSQIIRDPSRLTAVDHVRDLEALRKHLHLDRLTIIGESWGSGLALLYASRNPGRVERVVFLGPMPPTKAMMTRRLDQVNETTDFYRRLAEMRRAMPAADDPVGLCRAMFAEYLKAYFVDQGAIVRRRGSSCDAPAEGVRNYQVVNDATFKSLGDWDFLPLLAKLRQPALVIEGAGSTPTLESVRAWAAALPNAQLVLIPNAGHFPQVERPDAFFPAVESFLANR